MKNLIKHLFKKYNFIKRKRSREEIELDILERLVEDSLIIPFKKEILDLCKAFKKSGQSGGSAPYTAHAISDTIKSLLLNETLAPLTGEDHEWDSITDLNFGIPLYQNNRDSRVFKNGKNATAYFIEAVVFDGNLGGRFTNNCSSQYIKSFPFTPKTFYIDVIETRWKDKEEKIQDDAGNWWSYSIKDGTQLKKVFEYYDLMTSIK